ncbi:UNVERIFIED_CONTAM: hypothetical protein PYX00_007072 [Menopon gallinae]|uniref:Microsomal glutathione S-transferase 1 n=1 Tax=Menopon gallinae TaxID=328185 RepID=A0AAW2HIB7_9NEOP
MSNVNTLMSLSNPVFKAYCFYSAILVVKMLLMSLLTGRQRFRKLVFSNPEDTKRMKNAKIKFDDPDVERVRRAHLNDIENIPLFFVSAWLYLMTNPPAVLAINLYRVYTLARIVHTIVYAVFVVPQPARAIAWGTGYAITAFMLLNTIFIFF